MFYIKDAGVLNNVININFIADDNFLLVNGLMNVLLVLFNKIIKFWNMNLVKAYDKK